MARTGTIVHNERTKLTASWFNALATAWVATGVFAPVVALLYGVSGSASSGLALILPTFACFGAGALLHSLGWLTLGRLRE